MGNSTSSIYSLDKLMILQVFDYKSEIELNQFLIYPYLFIYIYPVDKDKGSTSGRVGGGFS